MARTARIPILIAFGCILLVGLGLVYDRTDEGSAFSWDVVSRGELRETIQASGEIQAKTRINIGTNVAGEIKAIHVRDGDEVRAGQALVTIDQVRLRQQLFQVEAALDASRKDAARLEAAMARSRQSARRSESLFTDGLISDEDYRQAKLAVDAAELSYEAAKANVVQAEASVAATRDTLEKTTIAAPIAGRVTAMKAQMGEMAIPGTSNLP